MTEQKEKKLREEDLRMLEENKKIREDAQRKQIQESLNNQTYTHFKAYAEQQHPNNTQAVILQSSQEFSMPIESVPKLFDLLEFGGQVLKMTLKKTLQKISSNRVECQHFSSLSL
jgi:hypothetical protein